MDLKRQENESFLDWKLRLITAKIEKTIDLDWSEISEMLGLNVSGDHLRKTAYGIYEYAKHFEDKVKNNITDDKLLKEYEIKKRELQKEKQKFFDERISYNKQLREEARWDEINEIIERTITNGNLPQLEYVYKTVEHSDNDLMVSLNDLHFGADIHNAWNTYNSDICKERLNTYINRILQIKRLYNSENCYVCGNGDFINGNIHPSVLVSNRENIIEQIMGVSEIISEFIAELSKHFNNVVFTSVAGNHSRLGTKDNSLKNERLDDLIPWYVKARLQNFDNVSVTKNIDNTMSVVDIRGKKYLNVHGDYDSGKSAKQSCALMAGKDIYAICCGHLHHNATDYIDEIKIIMAGSFLGMDDYCISNRIVGIPQQLICVCNENGVDGVFDVNF